MTDLVEEISKLAEKATSGPWFATGGDICIDTREQVCCGRGVNECCGEPDIRGGQELIGNAGEVDCAYIAALYPERVKKLMAVVRAAEHLSRDTESWDELQNALNEFKSS